MTTRRQQTDDDPNILKDGARMRLPLYLADSLQRAIATHGIVVRRPGWRLGDADKGNAAAADEAKRERAYQQFKADLSAAWQNPLPNFELGPQEMQRSHAAEDETQQPTGDAQEDAYQSYCQRLTDAWRAR